ncbi:uncharacterized protein LOC123268110 [Cotesia glomerata]|uniref:Uncharacterized protein n=1 Tax=Cotesia glomerata TaxID=32391 RepID=A0AAV7HYB3_COTGL|nr:uncharacterized protein LOC123268110 [Cotesia glomerata]KAH0535039.1 hypothetical protein KQX54_012317 [Cotesia glomerata]
MSAISNENFDCICVGDLYAKITGYAESLEGIKTLKKGKSIFRFVINNHQGRQVRLLAWDKDAAKYESLITANCIYSFDCLKCTPVDKNYFDPSEGLVDVELHISSKTTCKRIGDAPAPQAHKIVPLREVANMYGYVLVEGFIHDKITGSGFNGSGSGSITDRQVKVRINVYNIKNPSDVNVPGAHVRVKGKLCRDKDYGLVYIQCQDFTNIVLINDETLSEDKINRNYRSPQPKRDRSQEPDKFNGKKFIMEDCDDLKNMKIASSGDDSMN